MSSTLDVLNTIYEQVKNKEEWGQNALYRDGKICLAGRLYSLNDLEKRESARQRLYEALTDLKEPLDISTYNDSHSHADVIQLVVRAIAIEKRSVNGVNRSYSVLRIS